MSIAAIIPARLASSRFPEKPLALIHGKPMILWVAELTARAVGVENTYVATDHEKITRVVEDAGFNSIMTSPKALTGTDRIAEAATKIDAETIVNVQGDEPMLDPDSILRIAKESQVYPNSVINGYAKISPKEDPHDVNIPKCIVASDGRLIYMSRAALPASKNEKNKPEVFHKQICIYAFNRKHLSTYAAVEKKAHCEQYEDIEILRFLDLGVPVQMVELEDSTLAVDVPSDVGLVEKAMNEKGIQSSSESADR